MNDNTKRVMEGIIKLQNKLEGEDKKTFIEIMFLFDRCAELLEIKENENKRLNNVINEITETLTPDYEDNKKLIDKRDIIDSLTDNYWLGVVETSKIVLDILKKLEEGKK